MKAKKITALILALIMLLSLCACGSQSAALAAAEAPAAEAPAESELPAAEPEEITITDMIGREVTVTPGSYKRVVCIGAGALRMYSYIGDVSLLCGVEDIDNTTLDERPKMFDSVARPFVYHQDSRHGFLQCSIDYALSLTASEFQVLLLLRERLWQVRGNSAHAIRLLFCIILLSFLFLRIPVYPCDFCVHIIIYHTFGITHTF